MKNSRKATRWRLLWEAVGFMGTILACMTISIGTPNMAEGTANPATGKSNSQAPVKLENGVVEVQGDNGEWTSVSGTSPLDVTAPLEDTDPWSVAGQKLQTDASTQIEDGLQIDDLVRVQGLILEDGAWFANSIVRAQEQVDPIIILVGRVDSVDPWSVNGIQLNVTGDTDIQGTVTPGMFVRVEILLSPDGTWEVLSITPLSESEGEVDCETVAARLVIVNGNEVQFSDWPTIMLDDNVQIEDESDAKGILSPGQVALLTVCLTGENQVAIIKIVVLSTEEETSAENGGKVLVCHKPDKKGGHTISIAAAALPAHLAHGDTEGSCPK